MIKCDVSTDSINTCLPMLFINYYLLNAYVSHMSNHENVHLKFQIITNYIFFVISHKLSQYKHVQHVQVGGNYSEKTGAATVNVKSTQNE